MIETTLWYVENKGLFSNHYLENQLLTLDEWKEPNNIEEIFSKIKALYQGKQTLFPTASEGQLRDDFLNYVLKYLGHYYKVGGKTEWASKFPDYGLFPDEKSADDAVKYQGTEDFYKKAIAICEAKAWEVKLDERDPKNPEPDKRTPNRQIDEYLRWSEKKWGVLTNGRFWRLYYRENSYRNYFYQVDLAEIIEKDDIDTFKYFFLFFRKEAFEVDVNNICFLDRVYLGSVDYAKDIGENLEENVYKAMKILAEGFINWGESKLTKTEDDLKIVQENTMEFLYRLLFIFFAEAEGLLDTSKKTPASKNYAENYSLDSLKKKIKNRIKTGEDIPAYIDSYWNQLQILFNFINKGTEASNIPKEKLYIPSYNGGLFDTEKNKFLSKNKIGDYYLAKAIDLLASTEGKKPEEKGFIDYSSLDIRHLGSIYEGLLEYKLKTATEPMVAVKEKGKEKWIPESEFKGKKYTERVDAGEIYLATDKGERKATGSYYTPEYIVKYIVENTLTPIVKEKMDNAIKNNEKCSDAILSIKILDPAMGSGHFLVEAVDFLGRHLDDAINKDIERELIKEWKYSDDWLRREIVSHCIYGVDLNPMAVELAKVSLWLKTISKDKPLSFLDHRLKCGNSLIGCNLVDLPWYPELKKKKIIRKERRLDIPEGFIKKIVRTIKQLSEISDETLDDIKKKETIFNEFKNTMEYDMIKTLADVRTSIYFGNGVDENTYGSYTGDAFWSSQTEWKTKREKWFAQKGREIAENKHFFHWELGFPEIFFEEGKQKENPGFDAVVGNPPYVDYRGIEQSEAKFLKTAYNSAKSNRFNYLLPVLECSLINAKKGGGLGFIVSNQFISADMGSGFRERLFKEASIKEIVDVSNFRVFKDAATYPLIFIYEKGIVSQNIVKIAYRVLEEQFKNKEFECNNVPQEVFSKRKDKVIFLDGRREIVDIIQTIWDNSSQLEDSVHLMWGTSKSEYGKLKINAREYNSLSKEEKQEYLPILQTADIKRHHIEWQKEYIKTNIYSSKILKEFEKQKVTIARMTLQIQASVDTNGCALGKVSFFTDETLNHFFAVSLLNSKLLDFHFKKLYETLHLGSDYIRYDIPYLNQLPIRRISFTTPKEEREKLVMCLKQKYQNEKLDEILKVVEECLPKDKEHNFITEKEKSDVIHDFLAFLAEQMIEMNKKKQSEVKGFTEWFEREMDAKIGDLTNKTVIEEYYKNNFEKLIEVLKKNKKKIPVDPSRREFQEKVKSEFDKSVAKLTPLKARIQATDNLIDQIVYKLYGLTDEEIKVVEESTGKKEKIVSKEEDEVT